MKKGEELPLTSKSTSAVCWWATGSVVALLVVLYFYLLPAPPENWSKVKVGMTMEEVNRLVPGMSRVELPPPIIKIKTTASGEWEPSSLTGWPLMQAHWGSDKRNWQITVLYKPDFSEVFAVHMDYRYKPWDWLRKPLIETSRSP